MPCTVSSFDLKFFISILFLFLLPQTVERATKIEKLIVWNVGQGQWLTFVSSTNDRCLHFDFGGEKAPDLKTLSENCRDKENQILLSHADWDHRSFFKQILLLPRLCVFPQSFPASLKTHKQFWVRLSEIPHCQVDKESRTIIIPERLSLKTKLKTSNHLSRILALQGVLATGDAPQKVENQLPSYLFEEKIRILILGHHGSKTSTSPKLLQKLKSLKMAVASARYQRYKHPHPTVTARLQKNKTPLIRTEQWGHLHFELKKSR